VREYAIEFGGERATGYTIREITTLDWTCFEAARLSDLEEASRARLGLDSVVRVAWAFSTSDLVSQMKAALPWKEVEAA